MYGHGLTLLGLVLWEAANCQDEADALRSDESPPAVEAAPREEQPPAASVEEVSNAPSDPPVQDLISVGQLL